MSGTKLPEVHRVRKVLDPNLRPEKQHAMPKKGITEKLHIGQGRVGLRRNPEPDCINQSSDVTRRISERSKIVTEKTNSPQQTYGAHDKSFPPDVLLHPDPLHKPLSKQHNAVSPINQNTSINLDIEENSPFQEGFISETIQRPDKSFFQNLKRLEDLIDTGDLILKFLPKETYCISFKERCLKALTYQQKLKRFKQDPYIVLTLKNYTNTYCKINPHTPNWP